MSIFLISTALSSNMLWVYICTKSLLYLFCYANGIVCGGEGPKHVCGLFMVVCLSLKLYPGANKQLGTRFFFSKMGLTEKQKKISNRNEGKDVDLSGTLLTIFLSLVHDFSYYFYYLLFTVYWCKQGCSICFCHPYSLFFLTTLINYWLSKMQILIKTNRNSSYFPQWDLDEHSVEQRVYPSVSDLDHVPSEKNKILTEQGFWI